MLVLSSFFAAKAQTAKVKVVQQGTDWQLLVNEKPFYVKGAGGHTHLDKLVEIGGNTIRTWSVDDAKEHLDEAHERGLMVMMGLWVQHERHGFDYDDEKAVKKQLDYFRQKVTELKDHPALLMWGVGNEVDLFYKNTKVWNAVQDIAKMIHEVDPNHPTSTVTAGLDKKEVELIKANCPDIDIYGINTYGDLGNAVKNVSRFGWNGPYMITEWGPNGHWEVAKTSWGVPIEQTSSEKAKSYSERYDLIKQAEAQCIGSFVFLWGQKQETTSTWYGVFNRDGLSTEVIDVLHKKWKASEPKNHSPTISSADILKDGKPMKEAIINAGESYQAKVQFNDKDGDPLKVSWVVRYESSDIKSGGDAEKEPPSLPGVLKKRKKDGAVLIAPKKEGAYRLFVEATDRKGNVAYSNIPFYVKPNNQKKPVQFKKRALKFDYAL